MITFLMRFFPVFNFFISISAITLLTACGQETANQPAAKQPPPQVTIAKPLLKEVTDWDEFTGRLYAVESVDVRPRVSGYLESVNFTEGSIVNKGDLLYVIDPRPYQAILDQTRADLKRAEAAVDLAENDLARAERLFKSHTISQEEMDARSTQKREALAILEAARASVYAAKLNIEFTHIKSLDCS